MMEMAYVSSVVIGARHVKEPVRTALSVMDRRSYPYFTNKTVLMRARIRILTWVVSAICVNRLVLRVMGACQRVLRAMAPTIKGTDSVFNAFHNAQTALNSSGLRISAQDANKDAKYAILTTLTSAMNAQRDTSASSSNATIHVPQAPSSASQETTVGVCQTWTQDWSTSHF